MLSNFHSNKAIDLFGEQGAITTCSRNHASSDDVKKAVTKVCDEVGESLRLWNVFMDVRLPRIVVDVSIFKCDEFGSSGMACSVT